MRKLEITYKPINELIPYINNARTHDQHQIDQIKASITEFGMNTPIGIHNNTIVYGHGRIEALKQLGESEVPTVDLSDLTKAQMKGYILADNRMALNAGWDNDLLKLELNDLNELDFDLSLTGFGDDEIAEFLKEEIEPQSDEDAVPEIPDDPITKEGDIWILGNHRVMCGNSEDISSIDNLMGGVKANSVVTDPPYGIGIDGQKESKAKNPKHSRKAHDFRGWDSERPDKGIFNYIVGLNCPAVIWGGNYFADLLPATRGWLYWSKGQDGLTMSDGELAWTTENKPLRSKTVNRAALQGSVHPTQKPLDIILFSIEFLSTPELGVVLDLFGGSGSTLIACEKTNRNARLMELDPKYCDVIVKRWQDYTGKEAIIDSTGETFNSLSKNEEAA